MCLRTILYAIKLSTNSMRLAGKASVPAGAPFIVLLPAVGPAVGPSFIFGL